MSRNQINKYFLYNMVKNYFFKNLKKHLPFDITYVIINKMLCEELLVKEIFYFVFLY